MMTRPVRAALVAVTVATLWSFGVAAAQDRGPTCTSGALVIADRTNPVTAVVDGPVGSSLVAVNETKSPSVGNLYANGVLLGAAPGPYEAAEVFQLEGAGPWLIEAGDGEVSVCVSLVGPPSTTVTSTTVPESTTTSTPPESSTSTTVPVTSSSPPTTAPPTTTVSSTTPPPPTLPPTTASVPPSTTTPPTERERTECREDPTSTTGHRLVVITETVNPDGDVTASSLVFTDKECLPVTGIDTGPLTLFGVGLVLAGGGALWLARRRVLA